MIDWLRENWTLLHTIGVLNLGALLLVSRQLAQHHEYVVDRDCAQSESGYDEDDSISAASTPGHPRQSSPGHSGTRARSA